MPRSRLDEFPAFVHDPRDNLLVYELDAVVPEGGPFTSFPRDKWSSLAQQTPLPLTPEDVVRIASLGDPIDLEEVDAIYRPLSALLQLYVDGVRRTAAGRRSLLRETYRLPTPFIIGIAGSVAVGKSTVSRLLRLLLSRWPRTPRVELITTDGFLFPNAELERRGLMKRKGFPETYDRTALLEFVARVKAGEPAVRAPVYSHITYDVVPGEEVVVNHPDILIVEGLNVLAPPRTGPNIPGVALSDYFDFKLYVDAEVDAIENWYIERFLALRQTAFSDPRSYFKNYAGLSDEAAVETARTIWRTTNEPNLVENIQPTRPRATMVLRKDADHRIETVYLRKI